MLSIHDMITGKNKAWAVIWINSHAYHVIEIGNDIKREEKKEKVKLKMI